MAVNDKKKSIEKIHGKKKKKLDQPMRNEVALSIRRNGCQIRDEEELGFNA